eukprot:TRINITY_DN5375_c0_g1_i1.p1 TRINITY_DN5375_c0_g1~~TRINITY_DN5375_c0_g1_i1.p1  ORF type:complete len:289 (-),score=34.58 TRINITY_DN5375_c0_g1_i1:53-919(-)
MRVPSHTDRILWKNLPNTKLLLHKYQCANEITTSDHSPVYAIFSIGITNTNTPFHIKSHCSVKLSQLRVSDIQCSQKPHFYIGISAEFLDRTYYTDVVSRGGYCWRDEQIPELYPITTNKEYLERQYMFVALQDKRQEVKVGFGVISLADGVKEKPAQFRVTISKCGIALGFLDGFVHVTWSEGKKSQVSTVIKKAGYLMKKGGKRKNWKRRWFVLTQKTLCYYEREPRGNDGRKPLGVISLRNTFIIPSSEKLHCFALTTTNRTYLCAADNDREMGDWIEKISKHLC